MGDVNRAFEEKRDAWLKKIQHIGKTRGPYLLTNQEEWLREAITPSTTVSEIDSNEAKVLVNKCLETLTEGERKAVKLKFGIDKPRRVSVMGNEKLAKCLRLGKRQARRRIQVALDKMRAVAMNGGRPC